MIINIQNKKDLITLDLRLKQIRYVHNIAEHGKIDFFDLSRDDVAGYEYLFKNNKKKFFESLKEDIKNNLGITINIKDLKVKY